MREGEKMLGGKKVAELVAFLKGRRLPLIDQKANIEEIVTAMIHFEHSRLLYVVDNNEKLTGTISWGLLARHVFSSSHAPQVHPRFIMSLITAETAKDIMQKNPVFTTENEPVETLLKKIIQRKVQEVPVIDRAKRVIANLTINFLFSKFYKKRFRSFSKFGCMAKLSSNMKKVKHLIFCQLFRL
jgi:CBS domain-containing protein